MTTGSAPEDDIWSEWLLHRRHADDPQWQPAVQQSIERYADRVLDNARLKPGMQLLDVGTGDGLVGLVAQAAGFEELHLELHIDVIPAPIPSWQAFLESPPHPLAPPLSVILAEQFSAEERQVFESVMRPLVEDPRSLTTDRVPI